MRDGKEFRLDQQEYASQARPTFLLHSRRENSTDVPEDEDTNELSKVAGDAERHLPTRYSVTL